MLFVFYAVQFDDCFVLFVFVLKERRQALQIEIDKASQPDKTVKPTVGISVVFLFCFYKEYHYAISPCLKCL